MKMRLGKEVMIAFYIAETAIGKVLSEDTLQWEQLDITSIELAPLQNMSAEDTLFTFRGYVFASENHFSVVSTVRMTKNRDEKWALMSVDVLFDLSEPIQSADGRKVYLPGDKEPSYACFADQSGELAEVAYQR